MALLFFLSLQTPVSSVSEPRATWRLEAANSACSGREGLTMSAGITPAQLTGTLSSIYAIIVDVRALYSSSAAARVLRQPYPPRPFERDASCRAR